MKPRPERVVPWSDAKKWWLDLVRFLITFGLGAIATYSVINRLDDRRLENRYLAQKQFELRLSAADKFRSASLHYQDAAADAYSYYEIAYRREPGASKTPAGTRYTDEAWPEYQVAVELVRERFASAVVHSCLTALTELHDERHKLYFAYWRPDGSLNEEIWRRNRDEWFRLLDASEEQRAECLRLLEADLAHGLPRKESVNQRRTAVK